MNSFSSDKRSKDVLARKPHDYFAYEYADVRVGNKTPSNDNARGDVESKIYPGGKKFLIDQSTLPNSNLSQSEINKINDLHNLALNRQLER